jgi:hypothetical protein
MPESLKRVVVSEPGAAIRREQIELPDHIKKAISESLERGKRVGRREEHDPAARSAESR